MCPASIKISGRLLDETERRLQRLVVDCQRSIVIERAELPLTLRSRSTRAGGDRSAEVRNCPGSGAVLIFKEFSFLIEVEGTSLEP